ncbi:MAG: DUF4922 domain-containing protein [Bacteroidetes bacterium]|nr:DUF4922 domain-containing protein [Bacteroidota bacterium]MCW5895205.1 DUF4922 domain-containing protein [Bacteroidota bacterium]
MPANFLLTDSDLSIFNEIGHWSDRLAALLAHQMHSWKLLRSNYDGLAGIKTRSFRIDGFSHDVQWNPGRIGSSSAKVDERSVRERSCFLCRENLPKEQRGIAYRDAFLVLCNPFPIFPEHFTIVHRDHTPQEIRDSFPIFLELSRDVSDGYVILYNGPKCGASAPDHLHFHAGNKGFLPFDDEYEKLITETGEKIADSAGLLAFAVGDFLRPFVSLECDDAGLLRDAFIGYYEAARKLSGGIDEPMMNIMSSFQDGEWRVIVFPRRAHRPSFFYEEGEKNMLLSPAAIDMCGIVTTPLEKDFDRISEDYIRQMFREVSPSREQFAALIHAASESLARL